MQLRLIVQIIIRLASLYWLALFLIVLPSSVTMLAVTVETGSSFSSRELGTGLAIIVIYLALAGLAWFGSRRLSRWIVGSEDVAIDLSGLRLADLYCVVFVFLGSYFVLGNLAQLLDWIHFDFIYAAHPPILGAEQAPLSRYGLSQPLLTTIAGLISIFKAGTWSRKLAARAQ